MAGQLWSAANGYMATPTLSEELRHAIQPLVRFRNFCDVEEALGKNSGETFTWNIYGDTKDEANDLNENTRMPETTFPISQGTVTVGEGGIAVPYSGKFDDLSEHPVKQIINKTLKNNARRYFDSKAHAQFNNTILRAVGGAGGSITLDDNGTPTGNNNISLSKEHVKTIADTLEERNVPVFDGEHYMCVARPTTLRPFRDELEAIHQYTNEGWHQVMAGERGRYGGG